MNVLITGGNGFLGRFLCQYAVQEGYQVFAPRSSEFNLEDFHSTFQYFNRLGDDNIKIDVVIHSAAYYGGIGINQTEPANLFYKNTVMAANLYEAAAKAGVKKVVAVGSACSYPANVNGCLKETEFWEGRCHDSVEAYGFSKKVQLVAQTAYHKQYGIEGNHLILTNLYGPGDVFTEYRSHVVAALIKKFVDAVLEKKPQVVCWGDGSPIREFMYVEDAARLLVQAIELPHDLQPVNIGTGVETSIKELTELIAEISGFKGKIVWDTSKPNGIAKKVLDVNRMKGLFNYTPIPLRQGLEKTIDWYVKNKEEADSRK